MARNLSTSSVSSNSLDNNNNSSVFATPPQHKSTANSKHQVNLISQKGTLISNNSELKIIQINLNRSGVATSTLVQFAQEEKADVILFQEPYIYNGTLGLIKENAKEPVPLSWKVFLSVRRSSGIAILNQELLAILIYQSENSVVLNISTNSKPVTLVSFYSPPPPQIFKKI